MSSELTKLAGSPADGPVFRRRHVKADGRELFLYGYRPPGEVTVGPELRAEPSTSELRRDPLRNEWSVYAAARQERPFKPAQGADPLAPAAPGAPATEIPFADYEIAVFENRFPSLNPNSPLVTAGPVEVERAPACGRCEVVVYTPSSTGSLADLGDARRRLLVRAWIDRYRALYDRGFAYVLPFENRGEEVGVTLHHPHGQIYAFNFVPEPQRRAARAFAEGYDLVARLDSWSGDYEIARVAGMAAFAPPFARFPYESWISPLRPRPGPWAFDDGEIDSFALLLGDMTRRYDALFGRPTPYMLTLHAAPLGSEATFQFTAQFYPLLRAPTRVKYLASVEQATGVFTVDVMPERAAAQLRAV